MIVPEHWAEAKLQVRRDRRSITVRRFGWSDESVAAAQAHADERVKAALDAILSGQSLPRRELRSNYGILGVPIREQIVERHGEIVVTRNSYGALCLNTPNVLFADMDFEPQPSGWVLPFGASAIAYLILFAVGSYAWNWKAGFAGAFVLLVATNWLALNFRRISFAKGGGAEGRAMARVEAFSDANPGWHIRLYRTPAGLRVLAMHRTFLPENEDVARFFHALRADGLYSAMCKVQQCFRARLTAKPWRIGMEKRIRPRYAAWSVDQASRPDRLQWIAEYERKAGQYAACRYVKSLGDVATVDPNAEQVRELHDELCRAGSDLPTA